MSILNSEDSDSIYANQQSNKKTPSVLASIANSLFSTFELVQHVWPNRFVELVSNILSIEDSDKTKNQTIIDFILQLKEVVFKFLSGRQPIYKEASNVMHLATFLCGKLEKKSPDFNTSCEQVVTWLDEIAKERPIEETTLTRDIIALLIQSSANISEFSIIHKLCRDIHLFTGDLEVPQEETQLEPNVNYQIVNLKTFAVITTKVFEFLDASFDDLTWCIGRLKLCGKKENTVMINCADSHSSTSCCRTN
jgi:Fanconi anemia group I protein